MNHKNMNFFIWSNCRPLPKTKTEIPVFFRIFLTDKDKDFIRSETFKQAIQKAGKAYQ